MFELIGVAATAASTIAGYVGARRFVEDRLRYVDRIHGWGVPWMAGLGAAIAAAPVVWLLPLVGGATAIAFGVAVGAGVATGARHIRRALAP